MACKACLGDHAPRRSCPGITPAGEPAAGEAPRQIFLGFDCGADGIDTVVAASRDDMGRVEFRLLTDFDEPSPLGDQVVAFAEQQLDADLTDWQRAWLRAVYTEQPGDPGALART